MNTNSSQGMQNWGLGSSPPCFSTVLWKSVPRGFLALKANPLKHLILPCLPRIQRQKEAKGEFLKVILRLGVFSSLG